MATDNPVTKTPSPRVVRSTAESADLARDLLPLLKKAGVVSLEGPLGAGKTHFVKAVASLLGIAEPVTSPTFTLLHTYLAYSYVLHHTDWDRLDSAAEAEALVLEEYYGEGVTFIEWGERIPEIIPPVALRIRIEPQADDSRLISWKQALQ